MNTNTTPLRFPTKAENPDGLHERYDVTPKGGIRCPEALYFVLRLDNKGDDPAHVAACRTAARAYVSKASQHPHLYKMAQELYDLLNHLDPPVYPIRHHQPPAPPVRNYVAVTGVTHVFPLTMACRDAALLVGDSESAHRGVWFYDRSYPDVRPGERVEFTLFGETLERGVVTRAVSPADFPQYCSGLNDRGFLWVSEPHPARDTPPLPPAQRG